MRARLRRPSEDRVALVWPRVIGRVVQVVHYRMREVYSLLQDQGLHGAAYSVALLPTPGQAVLCRYGDANQQLLQRYRLAVKLSRPSISQALSLAVEQHRTCCVTNRILAQCFARMCGEAADPAQARRQLRQMLLLVAPDKVQGLAAQVPGERVHACIFRDATQTLLFFRGLLEDPHWSAAIFAPGRLHYGQGTGPLGGCVVATFSVVAAWGALAWGAWKSLFAAPQAVRRGAAILALTGPQSSASV